MIKRNVNKDILTQTAIERAGGYLLTMGTITDNPVEEIRVEGLELEGKTYTVILSYVYTKDVESAEKKAPFNFVSRHYKKFLLNKRTLSIKKITDLE